MPCSRHPYSGHTSCPDCWDADDWMEEKGGEDDEPQEERREEKDDAP